MILLPYHYKMTPGNICCSEIYFNIDIATLAFFWISTGMVSPGSFVFNLSCFYNRCVAKSIRFSCAFYIQLDNLLLIWMFRTFTFNMVINIVWFKSIIFRVVFYLPHRVFLPFSIFLWLLCIKWAFLYFLLFL